MNDPHPSEPSSIVQHLYGTATSRTDGDLLYLVPAVSQTRGGGRELSLWAAVLSQCRTEKDSVCTHVGSYIGVDQHPLE